MNLTLVIMAAGMGSRYGGLKQIEPVGTSDEIIMEYAIFDAIRGGFDHVVFVIKEELEADFRQIVGDKIAKYINVSYAYQKIDALPNGHTVPEGRTKPWGTGHAVLSAKPHVNTPFCVINADDFYGRDAFAKVGEFLKNADKTKPYPCCMAGYLIENTLTENGTVARGVCCTDTTGVLTSVTELTKLHRVGDAVTDDNTQREIALGTPVSLNMWGFSHGVLSELETEFSAFLKENPDPIKGEFYLPSFVSSLIADSAATVQVLSTEAQWYGVTYKEDRQTLVDAIGEMTARGDYSSPLFP